jgi:hypothetical protein
MEVIFNYFAISMTCLAIISYGWLLVKDWRTPKKEEEEVTLPDGRKIKVKIPPPLDLDHPWNRGKHWFFRSPYRGTSPFVFFLVIVAVLIKYGWAGVGVIWIFVLVMGGIGIIISLFEKG